MRGGLVNCRFGHAIEWQLNFVVNNFTCDMGIDGIVTIFSCFNGFGIGSFLTANATGMPPSAPLMEAAGANPAPAGNEFTPACTTCC